MACSDELVDVEALQVWLAGNVKGDPPLVIERMGESTGVANALFAVHWGERDLVLRRGPAVKVTDSAGNTMREALAPRRAGRHRRATSATRRRHATTRR